MKAWTKLFIAALCFLCGFAHAKIIKQPTTPLDFSPQWSTLSPEQQAVAKWISEVKEVGIPSDTIIGIVRAAYAQAERLNLDPMRILAITRVESRFNPNATSHHGAKGLMQVLPRWHRDKLRGRSPYNPDTSIEVGSRIYKEYLDLSKGNQTKALFRYLGGADRTYVRNVLKAEKDMRRYVLFALFDEPPVVKRDTMVALE